MAIGTQSAEAILERDRPRPIDPDRFLFDKYHACMACPGGVFGNGTKGFPLGLNSIMERLTAYLVSAGIIAFGIWIVATAELWWGSLMFWRVVGMASIAVGMASLVNEIHNDRQV
jgi:hypothetical protein